MGIPDLGQHYLIDRKIVTFIVENAGLEKDDVVLEVGPGRGALTFELAQRCQVIAVERSDEHYEQLKQEILKRNVKNVTLVNENILTILPTLHFTKIVSNIPYSISEPLFYGLAKKDFASGVMTLGENFYQVLQGGMKAGILFSASYGVEKLKDIPKTAFYPPPRASSCIISIKRTNKVTALNTRLKALLQLDDRKLKNSIERMLEGMLTKRQVAERIASYSSGEEERKRLFERGLQTLSNQEVNLLVEFLKTL